MTWIRAAARSAVRGFYYVGMYTGLRALLNRARSRKRSLSAQVRSLDGVRVPSQRLGRLLLRVHGRDRPAGTSEEARFGMVSLRQVRPTIGRIAYRWICATTHMGCGHVEVAFYEERGLVTFYAVRNMARANAARLGCTKMAAGLRLAARHEDALVLTEVSRLLSLAGMKTRQAQPEECLRLALNRRLARGGRLGEVRRRIYRKYEKLHAQMNALNG